MIIFNVRNGSYMEVFQNGNVISKIKSRVYQIKINAPTSKEEILKVLEEKEFNSSKLLDSYDEDSFMSGIIECLELQEGLLFIYKQKKNYYLSFKDSIVHTLIINPDSNSISYYEEGKLVLDITNIKCFVDLLGTLKRKYTNIILYDVYDIYNATNLVDETQYKVVIEDDIVELLLLNFRTYDTWRHLTISLKKTKEDIGYIEFHLEEDNFSYKGNVSYEIKEPFRKRGYATRALGLAKKLVEQYGNEVDKCLYIATTKDNLASQKVILNNGGKLFYEGCVPLGDIVRIQNKIDYVKIYTIDE